MIESIYTYVYLTTLSPLGSTISVRKKIENLLTTLPSKDHLQLKGQSKIKYFNFYWKTTHTLSRKNLQNVKKSPEETDSSGIL